jgi:hypothetical protein
MRLRLSLLPIVLLLSRACFAVEEVATLQELVANTKRSGHVLLDQGYRGEFTKVFDEVPTPGDKDGPIEFTHAWLNHKGIGERSEAAQTIAIGMVGKQEKGREARWFRSFATYREVIPEFEDLKNMRAIKDFESVFGAFRGMTDGWGSPGEMHSSVGWMAFTLLKQGSIRVVGVFLHTVNKGSGWEIEKRDIREGVFRPTGHPPQMETRRVEPGGAANGSQPIRSETNRTSSAAGSRR